MKSPVTEPARASRSAASSVSSDHSSSRPARSKCIRLLNINTRSVVNKTEQLESLLLSHDPHIVVLTETWLHDGIHDDDLMPPTYNIFHRDRLTRGGGVAVIVKSCVEATALPQAEDSESLFLRIKLFENVFILCAVYRPLESEPDFLLNLQSHMALYNHQKLIIAGDFNLPSIDWDRLRSGAA